MSKLDWFLNPSEKETEKEIVVSERFKDDKGKPATIKLKAITQADNNVIMRRCTIKEKGRNGVNTDRLDTQKYTAELILACIIEPNFRDPKFVESMGVASPSEALTRLFNVGEYSKISQAVLELMGLSNNEDLVEEAKN